MYNTDIKDDIYNLINEAIRDIYGITPKDYSEKNTKFDFTGIQFEEKLYQAYETFKEGYMKNISAIKQHTDLSTRPRLRETEKLFKKYVSGIDVEIYETTDIEVEVLISLIQRNDPRQFIGKMSIKSAMLETFKMFPLELVKLDKCKFIFNNPKGLIVLAAVGKEARLELTDEEIIAAIARELVFFSVRKKLRSQRIKTGVTGFLIDLMDADIIAMLVSLVLRFLGILSDIVTGIIIVASIKLGVLLRFYANCKENKYERMAVYVADMLMKKNSCLFEPFKSYLKKNEMTLRYFRNSSKLLRVINRESAKLLGLMAAIERKAAFIMGGEKVDVINRLGALQAANESAPLRIKNILSALIKYLNIHKSIRDKLVKIDDSLILKFSRYKTMPFINYRIDSVEKILRS